MGIHHEITSPVVMMAMKKYAFEIHHLLDVSNVFYRIMYNPLGQPLAQRHPLNVIIIQYPVKLVEVSQSIFNEDISTLKLNFFNHISHDRISDNSPEQNQEVITFLN